MKEIIRELQCRKWVRSAFIPVLSALLVAVAAPAQTARAPVASGKSAPAKFFALRLRPGQDLRLEIERFSRAKQLKAGFIVTTVGSLDRAVIRLADQSNSTTFDGKFEIVSLTGTISPDGVHLHLSVSDNTGKTIGGHLVEGSRIYTTAEIVIGEAVGVAFGREMDGLTGYKELTIRQRVRRSKRR